MTSGTSAWVVPPGGEAQPIEYKNVSLDEKTQPLVSCLMVTRGDVRILRHSLDCYLKQDYRNRELIVVSSNVTPELERFLSELPDASIRLVRAPPGISLGELRNISVEHAQGVMICQWDDDDLHDPQRITTSVKVLLASNAGAFFLSRWLVWWPERKLIALSQQRTWEGSMVAFKDIVPPFPAVSCAEDTPVLEAITRNHSIAVLEMPWLYCYTITGQNTWEEAHFERMFRLAAAVFKGDEYEQGLNRLARRIPIRRYAETLDRRRRETRLLKGSSPNTSLKIELSELTLNTSGPLRRERPRPEEFRQPEYDAQFDFHTIFYDYFLSADGLHSILVGPPLFNLKDAVYATLEQSMPPALPAEVRNQDRIVQAWLPPTVTSLKLPPDVFEQSRMVVQPSHCQLFNGKKVLLTKSKDNDLVWIRDWALFFASRHGCNAILFYDNGSTKYHSDAVRDTLSKVPGIEVAIVVDWPYRFGPQGSPIWDSDFSQYGILEHARHRFLAHAEGVVNADIDEFILTENGSSVFDYLRRSKTGYLKYVGRWIESATCLNREPRRHADFVYQEVGRDDAKAKWTVNPRRCPPRSQWRVHDITGMHFDDELTQAISIRHFCAITTNWMYERYLPTVPNASRHVRDEELARWMEVLEAGAQSPTQLPQNDHVRPMSAGQSTLPNYASHPTAAVRENLHITVGVPLYHSWDCIVPTLRSIECQTYQNITVAISADANDQRSADACLPFLADPRFRLTVQRQRLGWAGNINWLMSQAEGDFFCYHQHDDHTDPTYFATLIETARREPQTASVYCDMQHFGGRTELLAQESIRGANAFARVIGQITDLNHASFHGIINCQAIREAGPIQVTEFDSYAADAVWIAKLLRWGDLVRVPQPLYFKWIDPETVHGKWFRWERAQRREPWIGLFLSLLEVGQSVAETPEQGKQLLQAIVNRLAPQPTGWAFYQTESPEERVQLIEEFIERAERKDLCILQRDPEYRRLEKGHPTGAPSVARRYPFGGGAPVK